MTIMNMVGGSAGGGSMEVDVTSPVMDYNAGSVSTAPGGISNAYTYSDTYTLNIASIFNDEGYAVQGKGEISGNTRNVSWGSIDNSKILSAFKGARADMTEISDAGLLDSLSTICHDGDVLRARVDGFFQLISGNETAGSTIGKTQFYYADLTYHDSGLSVTNKTNIFTIETGSQSDDTWFYGANDDESTTYLHCYSYIAEISILKIY